MEEKKTCFNCKYFIQYYIINVEFRFCPINKGHCANGKVSRSIGKNRIERNDCCDLWQPCELRELKQHYGIEMTLMRINKELEEIRLFLQDR